MSDEVILLNADICNHYINRLHEISDEIALIRNGLNEAGQITELNWAGESGKASQEVIAKFDEKFKDIDNALSEIMLQISGLSAIE